MVPSGTPGEISTPARSWGQQFKRERRRGQEICVCLGLLLCECPQEMLFYVKRTLVFKASMLTWHFSNPSFDVSLLSTCWEGSQDSFLAKIKKKRKKENLGSQSVLPILQAPHPPSHSQRDLLSVVGWELTLSYMCLVRVPRGHWELKKNHLSCLSKSSFKLWQVMAPWSMCPFGRE